MLPMNKENIDKPTDLCVPIYLNQQIVFDLLAILEDGFTQMSTITKSQKSSDSQTTDYGASIGLSNVFAFLGVALKSEEEDQKSTQSDEACAHQKIHTPTSLFSKLRLILNQKKMIKTIQKIENLNDLASGDFVEFKAVLRKNPLVVVFEMMKQVFELTTTFSHEDTSAQKKPNLKPERRHQNPNEKMVGNIDAILKDLHQSGSLEIIGEIFENKEIKAVLSTKIQYFNNRDTTDLIDGEFRVFGKVVRIIKTDSNESINLLRKTSFGMLDKNKLAGFPLALESAKAEGVQIPEFIVDIHGPAIQIIPIAIFT